jgi:hypothetical protein
MCLMCVIIIIIIIKYLYGVRWIGTDSILLLLLLSICMKTLDRYGQYFTVRATFPRGPFNGASRCHCY